MERQVGDRVHVRTLSGAISERVVAGYSDEGDLLVCTLREYEVAQQEGRQPRGIGWPAEHILDRQAELATERAGEASLGSA